MSEPSSIRVISFNVLRPEWGRISDPPWEQRKHAVAAVLQEVRADVLALQEESEEQLDDILAVSSRLQTAGERPWGGGSILYRADLFHAEQFGVIRVPERMEAFGGRTVQWALLRIQKTGEHVLFYNAHLTPFEETARVKGVKLILEHLGMFPARYDAVIIAGDLNSRENEEPITRLLSASPSLRSAWRVAHQFTDPQNTARLIAAAIASEKALKLRPELPPSERAELERLVQAAGQGTFHDYLPRTRIGHLDYILVSDNVDVTRAEILSGKYRNIYPSDHFPVLADVTLLPSHAGDLRPPNK